MDRGGGALDDEAPAVPGDVPEKLVVVVEKAELAIRGVGKRVNVLARLDEASFVAKIDALPVRVILNSEWFLVGIESGGEHLEADDVAIVERVGVAGGKVAVDAVADLVASGNNGNGFSDEQ